MEFLSHGCFLGVQWRLFITWLFCVVGSMKIVYHMVLLCSGFNGGCLSRSCLVVGSMEFVYYVVIL